MKIILLCLLIGITLGAPGEDLSMRKFMEAKQEMDHPITNELENRSFWSNVWKILKPKNPKSKPKNGRPNVNPAWAGDPNLCKDTEKNLCQQFKQWLGCGRDLFTMCPETCKNIPICNRFN